MAYCDRCGRWFPHNRALLQHESDSNAHWPCDDCNLDFSSYDARRRHYVESTNHSFCGDCDRHFDSEVSRIQHMSAKHWYCRAHDKTFTSEHGLQSHYKQSPYHHFCIACGRDFDDEDELWEHAEEDHDACPECHELFDSYDELRGHDLSEHNYCTDCQKGFQSSSSLRDHMRSKHSSPGILRCLAHDCDIVFALRNVKSRIQHMVAKHPYCQMHNRVFESERGLQSHLLMSSDHIFDNYDEYELPGPIAPHYHTCPKCQEVFNSLEELQDHDRDKHLEEIPIVTMIISVG